MIQNLAVSEKKNEKQFILYLYPNFNKFSIFRKWGLKFSTKIIKINFRMIICKMFTNINHEFRKLQFTNFNKK